MNQTLNRFETKPPPAPGASPAPKPKPPTDSPSLVITGISFGGHTITFSASSGRTPIPKDAVRLELFYALSDDREDAPLSKAKYWRSFVQSPIQVQFEPEADKKTATYYARWANENGDVGPWSGPVSKTIAA